MKKFLIGLGTLVVVLSVFGFIYRGPLMMVVGFYYIAPGHDFSEQAPAAAPDYTDDTNWAALPTREDSADSIPNGLTLDANSKVAVDVFFVHPTTFVSPSGWNQPLDNERANEITDSWVMRDQASVFNGCCDVYAPRYRQATLYSFTDTSEVKNGEQALALAYNDVKTAFRYFIENYNDGRPFILAGHSQGSFHSDRLIKEEIVGTDLAQRMVAAYPIGFSLDGSNGLDVCTTPEQINCQVSWNTNTQGADVILGTPGDICVNPLTWQVDEKQAGFEENLGGVVFTAGGEIEPGVTDAQCSNGQLIISEVKSDKYTLMAFGPGNYHVYDYSLFHMNLRKNVNQRVAAYMTQ